MSDTAISVKGVNKTFKLPHEKHSSFKSVLVNVFRGLRTFEKQQVLKNVSFEIKKGEFFGVIGRNGSGKSTLLKLLAGIYVPDSGDIQVNGNLTPFIELGVGFNPELTGRENVFLNGALLGFNRKQMNAMYDDIVDFAELEKFMDQKLKNYSSGMQVRLAFSIAIRARTDILLVDEVLAVGDAIFQQKCYDYFEEIKKSDKTVVFISHDMGAVQSFCDRAVLIDNSRLLAEGKPQDVVHKYSEVLAQESNKNKQIENKNLEHIGAGGAEIVDAQILDKNKKPVERIAEGEPFTIRVHYKSTQTIENPVFGIGIMNSKGESLIGPNTKEANVSIKTIEPKGYIDATFKNNYLASGTYRVRAGILNSSVTVPYDFVEQLLTLSVVGKKRFGETVANPEWEVK